MLVWRIGIGVVIPGVLLSAAWRREGKREGKRRVQGGGGLRVCSVYDGEEGKGGKGRERKGREGGDICAWVLSGYSRVTFGPMEKHWTPLSSHPIPSHPPLILSPCLDALSHYTTPHHLHPTKIPNPKPTVYIYNLLPYLTQSTPVQSRKPTAFKRTVKKGRDLFNFWGCDIGKEEGGV